MVQSRWPKLYVSEFSIHGFGFQSSMFKTQTRIYGSEFRVHYVVFRLKMFWVVKGSGFIIHCLLFIIIEFSFQGALFIIQCSGFKFQG